MSLKDLKKSSRINDLQAVSKRFILKNKIEALARVLLPEIQAFIESEEGQKEFAKWKAQQRASTTEQE